MTPAVSRLSLLALAIAAATSAQAADLTISSSGSSPVQINSPYDTVTVESGVSITTSGVFDDALVIRSSIGTLNNAGSLQATAAATFGMFITGGGSVGTLNNSGTIASTQSDALYIASGTTVINHNAGSISGSQYAITDLTNSSTLNWNGGTISGTLRGLKTFNLNLDHASLNGGSLNMPAGSTLRMRLTADNSTPVLSVSSYSFGAGSKILLRPSAGNFAVNNQSYTLIQGEGNATGSLTVASESPYLTVHSSNLIDHITATVSISDTPQINGSPNAQRAGGAITPLLTAMASGNPDDPVLNALAGSQAVQTSEQLVPQVNGAALQAAQSLNGVSHRNAGQRTQGLRGASAGDVFVERGLWFKALGSELSQDQRDGIEGYDADLSGLAIGADGKLNDQLTLGLAYSYLNSDITADGGNQTDIDGHAITLYSGYEHGAWFLDSSLTLGVDHNDSTRQIAGTEAKGDYDSQLLGLDLVGGYGFALDNGLLVEPRAAARYARVDIDGFREKGSIAALDVEDQRYEVAELGAGLRLAGNLPLGQGTLQPQATVMAYHDFAADQIRTNASFTFGGSPFLATGANPARTRYEAGLGLDYVLGSTTLGVSYDYSGKEDFHADTLQAKVRYDF